VSFPGAEALGCFLFARRALGTRTRKCPNSRCPSGTRQAGSPSCIGIAFLMFAIVLGKKNPLYIFEGGSTKTLLVKG
jgi:hypothetical protein